MKVQSILLVFLLLTNLVNGQEPPAPSLHITVIAGDGARGVVTQQAVIDPVVLVQDEKGKPVEGAVVLFSMPGEGPGGSFKDGSKTLTATTDDQGRVTAPGIQFNRLKGSFNIAVSASFEGRSANATIAQVTVAAHIKNPLGVSRKQWIGLIVAAAVIAGGVFAAKAIKAATNPNVLTATPGTPTVGGPQ